MRIRIRNGRILSPANRIDADGDLCIADGKIVSVLDPAPDFHAEREIDAGGGLLCPGVIDLGADFREPGRERKATIAGESAAAAAAGVATVVLTPDTRPVMDTPAVVELARRRAAAAGGVRVHALGALTAGLGGERLSAMAALREAGCIALSNGRRPFAGLEVMRRALEYAAGVGLPVFLEPEEPSLKNRGVMHEGKVSARLGLPGIPAAAETIAVCQSLLLVEQTGAQAHFCKLSCARSVALIRQAKRDGLPVSADVSIAHLHLTEDAVDGFNADAHLAPPLRTEADREALLAGLADGTLDAVCSDHRPHEADAKAAPFRATEPGASAIELLLPLVLDLARQGRLERGRAVAALTAGPAEVLGLERGVIAPGRAADVTLFRDAPWIVGPETLQSRGKNTAFAGREMPGRASHTLIDGVIVHAPE